MKFTSIILALAVTFASAKSDSELKQQNAKTLPDFDPLRPATVMGDKVVGMAGNETVYGPAIVGGDNVTYKATGPKKEGH